MLKLVTSPPCNRSTLCPAVSTAQAPLQLLLSLLAAVDPSESAGDAATGLESAATDTGATCCCSSMHARASGLSWKVEAAPGKSPGHQVSLRLPRRCLLSGTSSCSTSVADASCDDWPPCAHPIAAAAAAVDGAEVFFTRLVSESICRLCRSFAAFSSWSWREISSFACGVRAAQRHGTRVSDNAKQKMEGHLLRKCGTTKEGEMTAPDPSQGGHS